ncbi:MAG: hypothetical protein II503_01355, partial [Clostridia bacterium]|nr:hypothetical protein [Clostridia bacterium]
MTGRSALERAALTMLPPKLSCAAVRTLSFHSGGLCEIRLRSNGPFTVTVPTAGAPDGGNVVVVK